MIEPPAEDFHPVGSRPCCALPQPPARHCPVCAAQMDPNKAWWWTEKGATCSELCAQALTEPPTDEVDYSPSPEVARPIYPPPAEAQTYRVHIGGGRCTSGQECDELDHSVVGVAVPAEAQQNDEQPAANAAEYDMETSSPPAVPYNQHEGEVLAVIAERDHLEDIADRLAAAIAPPEVLGEHSSGNNPWLNALDYAEGAQGSSGDTETLRARIEALITTDGAPLHDSKRIKVEDLRAALEGTR